MKLEDIHYFSIKKQQHPPVFNLAQRAIDESKKYNQDALDIERRMELLTHSKGAEHVRQCSNFLAETSTYNDLLDKGREPHWVPETTKPTPDLQYINSHGRKVPVEVKHLNSPRVEHETLFAGNTYGGSVNQSYEVGLQQKVADFVASARRKFKNFNKTVNGEDSEAGELYLFFSKSIDAGIVDGITWEKKMKERVTDITQPLCSPDITLIVTDIDKQFNP